MLSKSTMSGGGAPRGWEKGTVPCQLCQGNITATASAPNLVTPGTRRTRRDHKKGKRMGRSVMISQSSAGATANVECNKALGSSEERALASRHA